MAEYIDRDKVLKMQYLKNDVAVVDVDDILDIEEEEVTPIKHGEWMPKNYFHRCSLCGGEFFDDEDCDYLPPYCLECGAKMANEHKDFEIGVNWIVKKPFELPFPMDMFAMEVIECPKCHKCQIDSQKAFAENGYYNYCPNCGAKMNKAYSVKNNGDIVIKND